MNKDISTGKICPYCNNPTAYVNSTVVYKRNYGNIYLCIDCHAWVGVHKGTDNALGRLANYELREAKKLAHEYFDQLWKRKVKKGWPKGKARAKAYKWLSKELAIAPEETHIGMFDVDICLKVVELCKPYCV